jgi:transcriptional regulator with XRE-family HTH domain
VRTPPARIIAPHLAAFGAELSRARWRSGLSRAEVARRAYMTSYGLAKIERGGNVTLASIALLANALRCQVADFFPRT